MVDTVQSLLPRSGNLSLADTGLDLYRNADGSPLYADFGSDLGGLDTGGGGFSFMDGLEGFSLAAQGIGGLMGAFNAYEQNKLMKDQFKASLAGMNRNLANSAATTNLGLRNQSQAAAQLFGHRPGTEGYNQYIAQNQVQVDGSPINV